MQNKQKIFTITAFFTILFFTFTLYATQGQIFASDTAQVTATVTVQNVSVSVSDGSVSYGTLAASSTQDTTSSGVNNSQTASNDGNIAVQLNIRGQDTANWTLQNTPGTDEYRHDFCITDCDTTPTWTALTTNYATLNASVAASGTQVFDLRIHTPVSSTSFVQQSAGVTVQAVAI